MPEINIELDVLRKRSIFLAVPMYGGQCHGMFARSVADLTGMTTHYGIQLQLYFLFNESLIQRARNYCADEFMRSNCSHFLFIDSDIGFNAKDVLAMLALQSDESPYDVIAAPYPKKCISWEKIKQAVDKGVADQNPGILDQFVGDYVFNPKASVGGSIPLNEPVEVSEAGTGFMMIRRKTMENFVANYPEKMYRPDHVRTEHFDGSRDICAFFGVDVDKGRDEKKLRQIVEFLQNSGDMNKEAVNSLAAELQIALENPAASRRLLSEDYQFCYDCQKVGMKTWLCPWIQLQHAGSYVFGGSLAALASIGAAATADPAALGKDKKVKK